MRPVSFASNDQTGLHLKRISSLSRSRIRSNASVVLCYICFIVMSSVWIVASKHLLVYIVKWQLLSRNWGSLIYVTICLIEKLRVTEQAKKCRCFIEPRCSAPCSYDFHQFSLSLNSSILAITSYTTSAMFILILSYRLCVDLRSDIFLDVFASLHLNLKTWRLEI
jgi:hypothetical protein